MDAPPRYVGEAVPLLGLVAMLHSGCLLAAMASVASVMLLLLMAWIAVCAAMGIPH